MRYTDGEVPSPYDHRLGTGTDGQREGKANRKMGEAKMHFVDANHSPRSKGEMVLTLEWELLRAPDLQCP